MGRREVVVAVTGASGAIYALKLLRHLEQNEVKIHLTISKWGAKIFLKETGLSLDLESPSEVLKTIFGKIPELVYYYHWQEMDSPIASGACRFDSMVIIPCSMGTLARIASGVSSNLVERTADVCLKEKRRLILVVRETPLSPIHLENMLKLANCGAIIMPASPGFYQRPKIIDEIVEFIVQKTLSYLVF